MQIKSFLTFAKDTVDYLVSNFSPLFFLVSSFLPVLENELTIIQTQLLIRFSLSGVFCHISDI